MISATHIPDLSNLRLPLKRLALLIILLAATSHAQPVYTQQRLSHHTSAQGYQLEYLTPTPDRTKIVFAADFERENLFHLYVSPTDGSAPPRQLSRDPISPPPHHQGLKGHTTSEFLAISPDGTSVFWFHEFSVLRASLTSTGALPSEVFDFRHALNSTTGHSPNRYYHQSLHLPHQLSFSTSGHTLVISGLAYHTSVGGAIGGGPSPANYHTTLASLFALDLHTGFPVHHLIDQHGELVRYSISPDGSTIVAETALHTPFEPPPQRSLSAIASDLTFSSTLFQDALIPEHYILSQDGRYLVYITPESTLAAAPTTGDPPKKLTTSNAPVTPPLKLHPTSHQIVFQQSGALHSVPPDATAPPQRLATAPLGAAPTVDFIFTSPPDNILILSGTRSVHLASSLIPETPPIELPPATDLSSLHLSPDKTHLTYKVTDIPDTEDDGWTLINLTEPKIPAPVFIAQNPRFSGDNQNLYDLATYRTTGSFPRLTQTLQAISTSSLGDPPETLAGPFDPGASRRMSRPVTDLFLDSSGRALVARIDSPLDSPSYNTSNGPTLTLQPHLLHISLDGTPPTSISLDANNSTDVHSFEISPDGRWIIFDSDADSPGQIETYAARASGSGAPKKLSLQLPEHQFISRRTLHGDKIELAVTHFFDRDTYERLRYTIDLEAPILAPTIDPEFVHRPLDPPPADSPVSTYFEPTDQLQVRPLSNFRFDQRGLTPNARIYTTTTHTIYRTAPTLQFLPAAGPPSTVFGDSIVDFRYLPAIDKVLFIDSAQIGLVSGTGTGPVSLAPAIEIPDQDPAYPNGRGQLSPYSITPLPDASAALVGTAKELYFVPLQPGALPRIVSPELTGNQRIELVTLDHTASTAYYSVTTFSAPPLTAYPEAQFYRVDLAAPTPGPVPLPTPPLAHPQYFLSPDSTYLVATAGNPADLYSIDLATPSPPILLSSTNNIERPILFPAGGQHVIFPRSHSGDVPYNGDFFPVSSPYPFQTLYIARLDGTKSPAPLTAASGRHTSITAAALSPDRARLYLTGDLEIQEEFALYALDLKLDLPGQTDSYPAWAADTFPTTTAATEHSLWGTAADPDHDHLPNLLEFAFATDPNTSTNPLTLTPQGIHHPLSKSLPGNLTLTLEFSHDLKTWNPTPHTTTTLDANTHLEALTAPTSPPPPPYNLRLRATLEESI